jgi:hypothetical protein
MNRSASGTKIPRTPPKSARTARAPRTSTRRPKAAAIAALESEVERMPDQPFAEGAQDAMDPDFRHRLVSEAAYRRYVERGYEDGYDLDDWLAAEADVDHLVVDRAARGRAA